jgi:hypothetical protein
MVAIPAAQGQLQQEKPRNVLAMEARTAEILGRAVLAAHEIAPFTVKRRPFPFLLKSIRQTAQNHTTFFLRSSSEFGVLYGCGVEILRAKALRVPCAEFRPERRRS